MNATVDDYPRRVGAVAVGAVALCAAAVLAAGAFGLPLVAGTAPADAVAPVLVGAAYVTFAAVGVVLVRIDIREHRLPTRLIVPAAAASAVLLSAAAALTGAWPRLAQALVGGILLWAAYAVLRRAVPGGMGGGDVRLAGLIGLHLGWAGWPALVVGALSAFVLGGAFAVILIAVRRAHRGAALAFGPWMLLGAWAGIVAGAPLARWYLELLTGAAH